MLTNFVDNLLNDNIDLNSLSNYDYNNLITKVKKLSNDIIEKIINKMSLVDSRFCFLIVYDLEYFENTTKKYLSLGFKLENYMIINILKNTNWGKDYILTNIDSFLINFTDKDLNELFKVIFSNHKIYIRYLNYFKTCPNIHQRFLFMKYILENIPEIFETIYPNFLDYLTNITYQQYEQLTIEPILMSSADISYLANLIFNSIYKDKYFYALKKYILENYSENDLAKHLLGYLRIEIEPGLYTLEKNTFGIEEFKKDANRLFTTSKTEKFNIWQNYSSFITNSLYYEYSWYYSKFLKKDYPLIEKLHYYGLGNNILDFIDKYLDLSENKNFRYLASGWTASVYQIGDYCLKLYKFKWSYEDCICPDLYLIIKNLEEIYIRDDDGVVIAGIEVQPYLRKTAEFVSQETLDSFRQELDRLGYKITDTLIRGPYGDNTRLLNSYKDANCKNPEILPDWFKETPLVLVDRDRIYKKDAKLIKQLRSSMD